MDPSSTKPLGVLLNYISLKSISFLFELAIFNILGWIGYSVATIGAFPKGSGVSQDFFISLVFLGFIYSFSFIFGFYCPWKWSRII